jgi:hypothetical protein
MSCNAVSSSPSAHYKPPLASSHPAELNASEKKNGAATPSAPLIDSSKGSDSSSLVDILV